MTTPTTQTIQWAPIIRKNKQLNIFPTHDVKKYSWSKVFKAAYEQFNRLSDNQNLGVKFKEVERQKDAIVQFATFDHPMTVDGRTIYPDGGDAYTYHDKPSYVSPARQTFD